MTSSIKKASSVTAGIIGVLTLGSVYVNAAESKSPHVFFDIESFNEEGVSTTISSGVKADCTGVKKLTEYINREFDKGGNGLTLHLSPITKNDTFNELRVGGSILNNQNVKSQIGNTMEKFIKNANSYAQNTDISVRFSGLDDSCKPASPQ